MYQQHARSYARAKARQRLDILTMTVGTVAISLGFILSYLV